MAIIIDFTKKIQGITQPIITKNAYWKITNINGDKNELLVSVEVRESKEAPATIGSMAFNFKPEMTNENFIAQSYSHLKSLDMFADSVDG